MWRGYGSVRLATMNCILTNINTSIVNWLTDESNEDQGLEYYVDKSKGGGACNVFQLLEFMECVCHIETFNR